MQILLCIVVLLLLGMFLRAFIVFGELPQISQSPHWVSRPGLWFCTHRASRKYKYQHLFLRLTPRDPSWAIRYPEIFKHRDKEGLPFATLGAGPREGKLFLEFNRGYDLHDPVSFEKESPSKDLETENRRLESLLANAAAYKQTLRFSTWGPYTGVGYNCNAMISSLVFLAGMPLPWFCHRFMLCPGIYRSVPFRNFLSHKI
jgi:hypothetical protein